MSLTSYRTAPPREGQGSDVRCQSTDRGGRSRPRVGKRVVTARRSGRSAKLRGSAAPGLTRGRRLGHADPMLSFGHLTSRSSASVLGSWLDLAATRSPTPSWGSTLGAAEFHGRVRNGVGWGLRAVTTRSSQKSERRRKDRCQMTEAETRRRRRPAPGRCGRRPLPGRWSREAWEHGGRGRSQEQRTEGRPARFAGRRHLLSSDL